MHKIDLQLFKVTVKARDDAQPKNAGSNDRESDANWINLAKSKSSLTDQQYNARAKILSTTPSVHNTTQLGPKTDTNEGWAYTYITNTNKNSQPTYDLDSLYSKYKVSSGYTPSSLGYSSGFTASQAYNDAMAYTNQLLSQLNTGRTAYSDKVDELMGKIENRDKFQYDFNTDPLFQNALASAMTSGQTAMQDTMGQAAGLTGGYGSSYATSAANQAYNSYIQDAYANLPDYYNLALSAYQMEGNELYNQLGMYQTADNTAYDRLSNAYSANFANAQNMYNQEYSNYWDTTNYNMNVAQYNASENYKAAQMAQDNAQFNANMAYKQYTDSLSAASSSGTESSGATFSQLNTLKGDVSDMVKRYGANSSNVENLILQIANNYDLSEAQISELWSTATANDAPLTYTASVADNGTPLYLDQYGNPGKGNYMSLDLVSVPSGGKKTSDQAKYKDQFNNEYTYAQLKALGWEKYIN